MADDTPPTPPAEGPAPRRIRAADADRDAVLDVLSSAHAAGRLDPHELDERQSAVMAAKHLSELPGLIDDLPEGDELAARLRLAAGIDPPALPAGSAQSGALAHRSRPVPPAVPAEGAVETDVAVLGGTNRILQAGSPGMRTFSLMGGSEIYLREALGPGREVTIVSTAVMAGHDIYVPGGVRVIDRTVNILAGNDVHTGAQGDGSNGTLILTGFNLMAGHDVKLDPHWKPPAG